MEESKTAALPTGTVTFLLTDIAGSTQLWDKHPDDMARAVARHDQLVAMAVGRSSGTLVKTKGEGDSTFAAFARATDAVAAALAIQRDLAVEPWGEHCRIFVRVAVHTGEAELRDGDYFGPSLNRAARLRGIAHGGQTVISQATADLVRDRLPERARLVELGAHRLPDLGRAETVFGLAHPDLLSGFPPLRSLEVLPNNLPAQLSSFVGRDEAIAALRELLATHRLVTLTGAAGCGKTRLALQVAAEVLPSFSGGVWFVDLAPLADPHLVAETVVSTLGVRETFVADALDSAGQSARSAIDILVEHLRARDLLLVLDNCEHVLDRAAELVETLVQSCPKLTVLATSREALGVAGEVSWRVPSLSVPDPRHSLSLATLENFEAVRLFVDRARVRVIGFTLDDVDGNAVVQICRRLDGIPLAIELAAARIDTLAAPELAVRLEDRFRLLTGGSRMGVERHQTLRAAVDWSYDALSAPERGLLERMSVFAGGCTLEAAEVVCTGGGLERDTVVDVMSQLVAKSLVVVDRQPRTARYRLFEIIRQYAREKLIASGEHERVRGRHSDWSAALLAQVERGVWGRDQATWLSVVDAELDNLRQALDYAVGEGNVEVALGMAGALGRFWMIRYSWEEGLRWLLDTLALEGAERFPFLRAQALNTAALLEVSYAGDIEAGRTLATQALDGFRELGTRRGIFWALHTLSTAAGWTGDHEAAAAYADEGLAVARASGHQPTIAYALHQRAVVAYHTGDYTAADAILAEATPVMRNAADLSGLARVLVTRGWALLASRQFASAEPILQEALIFYRQLGDQAGICLTLISLGGAALLAGDVDQAASCFEAAHPISTDNPAFDVLAALARGCLALDQGDLSQTETELTRSAQGLVAMRRSAPQWGSAPTLLAAFAKLSAGKGFFEKAARLFGAATEIHETDPLRHVPMRWIFYEHLHAKYLQLTMAALDDDAFNWAFEHGRAMSTEHALTYALKASQT